MSYVQESDKTTEQLLRNLVQDAEILNSYAQYAYARDVVLERADSQKMKSYTNEN